jgi:hypothetical protein
MIKYRVEYLTLIPGIILVLGCCLKLSTRLNSSAQNPEKVFRERKLMGFCSVLFIVATAAVTTLSVFSGQRYFVLQQPSL